MISESILLVLQEGSLLPWMHVLECILHIQSKDNLRPKGCAYPELISPLSNTRLHFARIPCQIAPRPFPEYLPWSSSPERTEELLEGTPLALFIWSVDRVRMCGCTEHTLSCEAPQVLAQSQEWKENLTVRLGAGEVPAF